MTTTQHSSRGKQEAAQSFGSKDPASDLSVVLFSTQEAARYLSVTVGTLANWRNGQGSVKIPFVKVGSSVKYRRADLNEYILSRFMKLPPATPPETVSVESADTLYSARRAAEYLGVAAGTLAHWRSDPRGPAIPFVKVGRVVRYRRGDLDRFVQSKVVSYTTEAKHRGRR